MIKIPKNIIENIINHCREVYPEEGCGILYGRKNRVYELKLMENILHSRRSFNIDPMHLLQVIKSMRRKRFRMLAIFHSHPFTEAIPSNTDIKMNYYPECIHIIVSLKTAEPEFRGYNINGDIVTQKEIILINGDGSNFNFT